MLKNSHRWKLLTNQMVPRKWYQFLKIIPHGQQTGISKFLFLIFLYISLYNPRKKRSLPLASSLMALLSTSSCYSSSGLRPRAPAVAPLRNILKSGSLQMAAVRAPGSLRASGGGRRGWVSACSTSFPCLGRVGWHRREGNVSLLSFGLNSDSFLGGGKSESSSEVFSAMLPFVVAATSVAALTNPNTFSWWEACFFINFVWFGVVICVMWIRDGVGCAVEIWWILVKISWDWVFFCVFFCAWMNWESFFHCLWIACSVYMSLL